MSDNSVVFIDSKHIKDFVRLLDRVPALKQTDADWIFFQLQIALDNNINSKGQLEFNSKELDEMLSIVAASLNKYGLDYELQPLYLQLYLVVEKTKSPNIKPNSSASINIKKIYMRGTTIKKIINAFPISFWVKHKSVCDLLLNSSQNADKHPNNSIEISLEHIRVLYKWLNSVKDKNGVRKNSIQAVCDSLKVVLSKSNH